MKILYLIILLNIWSNQTFAQINEDVKRIVHSYPKSISKPEKLAALINKDLVTPREKAAAIYVWVTKNIQYDLDAYYSKKKIKTYSYKTEEQKTKKEYRHNKKVIKSLLRSRSALCDGYSRLFKTMCDLTGIECKIIVGDSKTLRSDIGKLPRGLDHAWNAIKLNKKWHLVDATWGAGSIERNTKSYTHEYNEIYFLSPPELFVLKHYPKNLEWILTSKTKEEYAELPLYYNQLFKSEIEINTPKSGILSKTQEGKILFNLVSKSDIKDISYSFNNDTLSKKVNLIKENDQFHFGIPINKRQSGYLTIYSDGEGIATYKLNIDKNGG